MHAPLCHSFQNQPFKQVSLVLLSARANPQSDSLFINLFSVMLSNGSIIRQLQRKASLKSQGYFLCFCNICFMTRADFIMSWVIAMSLGKAYSVPRVRQIANPSVTSSTIARFCSTQLKAQVSQLCRWYEQLDPTLCFDPPEKWEKRQISRVCLLADSNLQHHSSKTITDSFSGAQL